MVSASNRLTVIMYSLSRILISRFLINLRNAAEPNRSNDTAMQHFSRFSVPGFRVPIGTIDRVVGNLGEPLEFRDEAFDNEDAAEHCDKGQPATIGGITPDSAEASHSTDVQDDESVRCICIALNAG